MTQAPNSVVVPANRDEKAYLITGVCYRNLVTYQVCEGDPGDLNEAISAWTQEIKVTNGVMCGDVQLYLKDEHTGEVGRAIFSVTNGEIFLTVPK